MTRPDWRGLILAAVALTFLLAAALTANGQTPTCPDLQPECGRLPCPYPSAQVTPAQQQEIRALGGPWVAQGPPPPGMKRSYPTAEDWWRDAKDLSYSQTAWILYCKGESSCHVSDAAWRQVARVVKPMTHDAVCFSWSGDHDESYVRYVQLYRAQPTMAQYLQLRCASYRGAGAGWAPDGGLQKAWLCREGVTAPEPEPQPVPPSPPPPPPPAPVPPPPPPELPDCTPFEGSACEAQCDAGRERFGETWTREWCLSPDRDQARGVGAKCASVCRGGEPEPPPEPEPQPEEPSEPELECWTGEVKGTLRPGIPSTGRLEVELFRVDCPPTEGGE